MGAFTSNRQRRAVDATVGWPVTTADHANTVQRIGDLEACLAEWIKLSPHDKEPDLLRELAGIARALQAQAEAAQREADIQMGEKLAAQMTLKAVCDVLNLPMVSLGNGWTEATPKILARIETIVDEANRGFRERAAAEAEAGAEAENYATALDQIRRLDVTDVDETTASLRSLLAECHRIANNARNTGVVAPDLRVRAEAAEAERDRLRLRLSFMEASEVTLQADNTRLRDALEAVRDYEWHPGQPAVDVRAIARAALAGEDT